MLARRVVAADRGTAQMRAVAQAIRDGSDAYLRRQFRVVGVLIVLLTGALILTKWPFDPPAAGTAADARVVAVSRGLAFLAGSLFSAGVGFFGMRLATTGNLRVAAAARTGFVPAMQLAALTGSVTGLLTTGLGLLGGTLIVLVMGERAYLTLLGFAFGGSLLALFMRVGGGIYTKAADVGADLVGKIEKDMPEDDPRNAATIADNVGDNVGDCAGMAADVFESYAVTMVAAMILGHAAFGPKAMLLPLLIYAVGGICSLAGAVVVATGKAFSDKHVAAKGGASVAMGAINRNFRLAALASAVGILLVGEAYLKFDAPYIVRLALDKGAAKTDPAVRAVLTRELSAPAAGPGVAELIDADGIAAHYAGLPRDAQEKTAAASADGKTLVELCQQVVPLPVGTERRLTVACLLGIVLTLLLMVCTEFWTSTEYGPVKSIVTASRTGHATNIIQGIAVGYESTVWSVLLIAGAVFAVSFVYRDVGDPVVVAFAVALAGCGMLTLTGDTLAMDVFGPVADNANGIGEMGYNRDSANQPLPAGHADHMPEAEEKQARQILADLDATGNTTKAITKGIAIGSAVIAAVSLFASFLAVLVKGNEESVGHLTRAEFAAQSGKLSVAVPDVFVGLLIGGAVPFLFSSMTIRAVGRAAFLIVNECRDQFRDPGVMAGTKKPDYGRVVRICTATAQKELIGPGVLAIFAPVVVGFLLGPYAPRRVPGRHDGGGAVAGRLHGDGRRGVGQRQEGDRRPAADGRDGQGVRDAQGERDRRHGRRPAQGHGRPRDQPADQGHEHGQPVGAAAGHRRQPPDWIVERRRAGGRGGRHCPDRRDVLAVETRRRGTVMRGRSGCHPTRKDRPFGS